MSTMRTSLLILIATGAVLLAVMFITIERNNERPKYVTREADKIPQMSTYKHIEGKPCSLINPSRRLHVRLLSHWHEYAIRNGIEYTITYGTLLGQYRNKEPVPWEHDVDVLICDKYYWILNQTAHIRNFSLNTDDKFRLVVHPEFATRPESQRTRHNCQGKVVSGQSDPCAFVGLIGRLIYRNEYLDIYQFIDKGKRLHHIESNDYYDRKDYYPLAPCTFMNLDTWCPKNKKKILQKVYGNFTKPSRVCKDGRWVHP